MLMEAEKGSGTFDRKWIGYSILIILGLVFFRFLFDTHTFEHQRQLQSSKLPSQSEFFVISKHFTATPRIPPTSVALKVASINCNFTVEPQTFTTDLTTRLRSL